MCWMESGFFFFRTPWYTLPKHKDQSSAGQYLWEILYVPQYGQTRAPQKNCLKFKAPGCVGVRQLYLSLSRPPPGLTVETVQLFCPHVSVVREREREGKSRSLNFFPLLALSFRPTLKALPEPTPPALQKCSSRMQIQVMQQPMKKRRVNRLQPVVCENFHKFSQRFSSPLRCRNSSLIIKKKLAPGSGEAAQAWVGRMVLLMTSHSW